MLQDSLLNLVLNARDACGQRPGRSPDRAPVQDTWLEFTVDDTGPGFSTEALDHALDPFFTTKGGEGSGLGLSMVYDMTKLAGGRVTLANTDRRKRHAAPAAAAGGRAPRRGWCCWSRTAPTCAAPARHAARRGHSVVEATSVPEALALRHLPEISALLSDIVAGRGQDGLDLLDALPRGPTARPI